MTHRYLTQNGKVMRETIGTGSTAKVLDFIYDNQGRPLALKYSTNGGSSFNTYYYVLNYQGDVVKLIHYIPGFEYSEVASYTYDAWGNVLSSSGTLASVNPLRYRGYYYDTETGFYYLQSRYYDPIVRRFLNADSYASTDATDAISCNMFAYCGNNPVRYADPLGTWFWDDIKDGFKAAWDWTTEVASDVCEWVSNAAPVVGEESKFIATQLWNNLDVSVGFGQGFYGSFELDDFIGVNLGGYGNYCNINLKDGELSTSTTAALEASVSIAFIEIGAGTQLDRPLGKEPVIESWVGINDGKKSITLVSGGAYLYWGGSFSVGLDFGGFFESLWRRYHE